MPPINPLIPHLSQPLRHSTNTLYRRDALASDGPLVSVVITVVILSILISGASLYLLRMLWAKMKINTQAGRGGGKAGSAAGQAVGGHGVPQIAKIYSEEGLEGNEKSAGATVRTVKAFKEWEDRVGEGGEVHHRKSRSRAKERANRGRSYSDELWSTVVGGDVVGFSDEDDDDDDHPGGDSARHAGTRALGTGSLKGGGSGSGKGTGIARHSSARRSRFMSLGGAPAGFTPLNMHPVREDDLVDVPLKAPGVLGQKEEQQRESWPLRSHMVGLVGGRG